MLQAFVALKPQQPPRTEPGLKEFFAGLARASYSKPSAFCTNLQADLQPYDPTSLAKACANEECKWALLQGEDPFYWQATLVLPDKKGQAALFYYLEGDGKPTAPVDTISDFSKKLFKELSPDIIRIGDDEGREKLRSRHGLSLMPGLGRVDWLQLVHPDVYSRLYNISELEAAPAYTVEVLEGDVLYLRVYGDPKNWNDAENISLANMIPAFLAGIGTIDDPARERESVRQIEKLWARAHKTAERATKIAASSAAPAAAPAPTPAAAPKPAAATPAAPPKPLAPSPSLAKPTIPAAPAAPTLPTPAAAPSFKLPTPQPTVAAPEPAPPKVVRPDLSVEASRPTVEVPQEQADAIAAAVAPASIPEPAIDAIADLAPIAELAPEPIKPEPAKPAAAKPEPAKPAAKPAPSVAEVAKAAASISGPNLSLDLSSVSEVKDATTPAPLYKARNKGVNPAADVFIAFDAEENSFRVIDRQEDFTWFLQSANLPISDNTLPALTKLIRTYYRPYLKHLQSIDDIPDTARKDPRLDPYRARVKAPFIDRSKAESQILRAWAFNPNGASLEELIIEQYQDWPITTESKRLEADLRSPSAAPADKPADKPAAKPAEKPATPAATPNTPANPTGGTPAATPQKSNMGLIIGVIVALVIIGVILSQVL